MTNLFENFDIKRIIVHQIFKREESGARPPVLNSACTTLPATGKNELQTRIIEAIGHNSRSIQMDIIYGNEGSTFCCIAPFLKLDKTDDEFIEMSKQVTNNLVRAQTSRTMPGGAVVVFEGTTSNSSKKCIGIIKAEKHGGFSLEQSSSAQLILKYIGELLLTPQQKLYKIAIVVDCQEGEIRDREPKDVSVFIFDKDNNSSNSNTGATYFYETFMGCSFQKKSEILTKDFYNYTKEFITSKSGFNGDQIVDCMSALFVYLKTDTNPNINVREFATTYFPNTEIIDEFSRFMEQKRIPLNNIRKDNSLIKDKLKNRKIKFSNAVLVTAPVDNFTENLEILEKTTESTTIKIKGIIMSES